MRLFPALLLVVLVAGCGGPPKAAAPTPADPAEAQIVKAPKLDDKDLISTEIGLVRNEDTVHVGEDAAKAFNILLNNRMGGFINERLPAGFEKPYETKVWQGAEDAFGVIAFSTKVVAAMYQESRTTRERANDIRQAYVKLMNGEEPITIAGEKVTYYFWNKSIEAEGKRLGGQRLMIMVFQAPNRPVFVTTAMGDERVMDALGMNETQARVDQQSADKILGRLEANQNAGKS